MGQRREFTCTPQLPRNILKGGYGFLRGKLIGDCPAREFIRRAKHLTGTHIGQLNCRAVDEKVKGIPLLLDFMDKLHCVLNRIRRFHKRADRQAVFPKKIDHLLLGRKAPALDIAHLIKQGIQIPARRYLRIEVAQRTCRRVSRVLQRLRSCLVVLFKRGQTHDALALNLHASHKRNRERNAANGLRLWQNPFANLAIAACRRLNQPPAIIGEVERQAIKLILYAVFILRKPTGLRRQALTALRPRKNLFFRLRLIHAPEPSDMAMRFKSGKHLAANAPGWRFRQAYSRLLFKPSKLRIHRIPRIVGDDGIVAVIIRL